MSVHSFWMFEVYRTARMTAWKTSEAIIKDVEVRLVTYSHGGKTKGRIDRSRVWIAATKKIWVEQINHPWLEDAVQLESYPDVDAPL
jgi:hypothetical protein